MRFQSNWLYAVVLGVTYVIGFPFVIREMRQTAILEAKTIEAEEATEETTAPTDVTTEPETTASVETAPPTEAIILEDGVRKMRLPDEIVPAPAQPVQNSSTSTTENAPDSTEAVQDDNIRRMQLPNILEDTNDDAPLQFVTSGISYFADALFVGDSRMLGICNFGTITNADFFCTGGLGAMNLVEGITVDGETFQQRLNRRSYGKVYVMVGMNDVIYGVDVFKENVTKVFQMIQEAQPNALIFMMANLHVSEKVSIEKPGLSNERLNAANEYMESLTDGRKSFYIDVNPLFDDANHCLPAEKSGDGIHISGDDYAIWSDWLFTQTITKDSKPKHDETYSFSDALTALKENHKVTRLVWEDSGVLLQIAPPDPTQQDVSNNQPIIQMRTADYRVVPWQANTEDLLATDWIIFE